MTTHARLSSTSPKLGIAKMPFADTLHRTQTHIAPCSHGCRRIAFPPGRKDPPRHRKARAADDTDGKHNPSNSGDGAESEEFEFGGRDGGSGGSSGGRFGGPLGGSRGGGSEVRRAARAGGGSGDGDSLARERVGERGWGIQG
ncbi:hypothetical protein CDD83_10966 [Cordyceps sp. RAO-2017]|nr:hypothetical protein CDD83_10966 [Cordyceps sp. RAO-2017]